MSAQWVFQADGTPGDFSLDIVAAGFIQVNRDQRRRPRLPGALSQFGPGSVPDRWLLRMPMTWHLYDRTQHRAAGTDEFVFHQLIPYIGNKRKLLGLIHEAIAQTGVKSGTFVDLMAGSGVVARFAKRLGFRVVANDWEPYAAEINGCYIGCNTAPPFEYLGGYRGAIDALNALPPREDWVTRHLCPRDDQRFDIQRDRLFYTRENGQRLDAMRHQVEVWRQDGAIDQAEQTCLLAPLLYQACYTSNTSGVFKGFHNGWGGQTGTALYRIRSHLTLRPAVFFDNGQQNEVHRRDALQLAGELKQRDNSPEIVYIDPPYNQHPYGSNYHVLNSVALWDKPPLTPQIEGRNKAAIREDWRTERRSPFNYRQEAEASLEVLLTQLDARFLLISYSTDGLIPLDRLVQHCMRRGRTSVVTRHYKRYRVSTQRFSTKPLNVEFVLIVDTSRAHTGPSAAAMCGRIRARERAALDCHPESQPLVGEA